MSNLVPQPTATSPAVPTPERSITLVPRIDILETENEYLVLADMPGVAPQDVDIRFDKGEVTVVGRRPASRTYEASSYQRSFRVDDTVAADKITAELKAGVLTIHLPKVEAVKPRRITVTG
ncbi:MAG: Hsp20/alpha crystallin family protein [Gemmataceae bacterium]|nr:Hsp20/alpha crystallin family protein [Gemmataceae bacterium]MCS7269748.1 Hsp20/alpha crystallin family protein [Gemmataceae bacterium]MDW8241721.1 Hsp20/alpha crystallin family protein [Thermogemmata sp.]